MAPPALRVTCFGTRGSIASPGPSTAEYGGNTPSIEVRAGNRCIIFDAGTGIRNVGGRLLASQAPIEADLFLTHWHWDHIQGLPFFGPLYRPTTEMHIHAAGQGDVDIQTLFAGQMGPIYFPLPFEALSAKLTFSELNGTPWSADGVEVTSMRVRHPSHTHGYRVRSGESSIVYIPDNELIGGSYPVGPEFRAELVQFLRNADILFHDAMFTDEEYPEREGWGHSTFRQAVELAEEAGVRRLFFFHHAPERTDAELRKIVDGIRSELARRGSALEVDAAAEGVELQVQERKQ